MKKLYLLLLLGWMGMSVSAQNVVQVEYFIDTDAGAGNNTIVSVPPAADGSFNFTANLTGVTTGFHKLYIRTRDSDGKWSLTSRRNIEVTTLQTSKNMVAAEYFFDTDPGAGNGTRVTLTTGGDITQNFITNTTGLTPGYHKLYIRSLDTDGNWSLTSRRNVEVPYPEANIVSAAEYFFDTDPGVGNGTPIPVSPQTADITQNFTAITSSLSPGYHKLYLRTMDQQGKWSLTSRRNVEAINNNATASVIGVEYAFGTDPGAGNAPYIAFATPAPDGSFTFSIPASQVPSRKDSLYLRVKDSTNKNWSLTQWTSKTFSTVNCTLPDQPAVIANDNKCSGNNASYTGVAVTGATGYVWTIPAGWTVVSGQNTTTISLTAPVVTTTTNYTLSFAAINACGTGTARNFTVTVNPAPAIPVITTSGSTSFCTGGSVILNSSATIGNQWFKDGTAITGATNSTYTANAAGSYTVTVTGTGGCTASSPAVVVTSTTAPVVPTISSNGGTAICNGNSKVLTSSAGSGNQWIKDGNDIAGAINPTYTVTAAGGYSVRVSNGGSCTAVSAVTNITISAAPATPVITAGGPVTFCAGGNVVLNSSATTGNQWSKDGTAITGATSSTYTASIAGSYTVSVSNAGGCSAVSAATVITVNTAPSTPVITAGGPVSFCAGGSVVLTSSATTGNQWLKDGSVLVGITAAVFPVNASGSYSVKVTNAAGCSASSVATVVTVNTAPSMPVITQNGNVLTSSAASGNQWFKDGIAITGATSQTYTVTQSGNYTVQVTLNGCASLLSDKQNVTVTAVFDPVLVAAVKVFPNPVESVINIVNSGVDRIAVVLYDMTGKKLAAQERITGTCVLPAGNLVQGCYLLYVTDERTNKSFYKLLVKN